MAERPEDLNLPNTVVARIIKEALPSGVNVGKDAKVAISKAASVFVLYATSCANNNALSAKRKTINVNDVFTAIEDMEFDTFIESLKSDLEAYKKSQASKKVRRAARASKSKESAESVDTEENGQGDSQDETEQEVNTTQDDADADGKDDSQNEEAGMDTSS